MVRKSIVNAKEETTLFMRYLWFYLFFFFLLVLIASYGLIAEA